MCSLLVLQPNTSFNNDDKPLVGSHYILQQLSTVSVSAKVEEVRLRLVLWPGAGGGEDWGSVYILAPAAVS